MIGSVVSEICLGLSKFFSDENLVSHNSSPFSVATGQTNGI